MGREIGRYAVTCPHPVGKYPPPIHYEVLDGRLRRWKCRDRNCADAQHAKATNQIAYHIEDHVTGAVWTEFEPDDRHTKE